MTHSEVTQNGSTKEFQSEQSSPVAAKTGKSVAAELNAKITAKQNSKLKLHSNGIKMEPPKNKSHGISNKTSANYLNISHDLQLQFIDKTSNTKNSFPNFHDVESRLTVSKIPVNDFKTNSAAPTALNLKRNYL